MDYIITEIHNDGDRINHPFEFENISDIQVAVRTVLKLKQLRADALDNKVGKIPELEIEKLKEDIFKVVYDLPNIECLPETANKVNEISVPVTDY